MSDETPAQACRCKKLALIVALVVTSLVATGFIWAAKQIHIVADDRHYSLNTIYNKPQRILQQAGITLNPEDEYRLSTAKLENGTAIEVYRAVPVTVTYQGKVTSLNTGKPTVREVADMLNIPHENIRLEPGDAVRPTAGLNIRAIILSEKTVEQEITAPYPIVHQPDANREKGVEETVEAGANGLKKVTFRLKFEDGTQVSSEVSSETDVIPAKPQIIKVGTRDTVETSRGTLRFRNIKYMEASAYLPTDGSSGGLTASGIPARQGIAAVDPAVIPLGTRVYVNGYGLALAADTGVAVTGNKIDLCMEDYYEAMGFGRRTVKVYILE
ncbi:MAG TPA: G5 domain-containing protein [Methylomusa anaerophila]|uniref:Cell wall-binding protein YocH n=1 Tax=Methylomusa anaerophila TaxID=1930071 RepID=A0A348AGX5_9FIRM|nr:3D domain-containing protein [Methylomusa anaerophila]BBB90323.1 cell wall-binding protein YocH precursor [Methylomusa anaerophila]HML89331.1 G5 domain-containing protein [Methylomusa anaerophila]